MLLLIKKKKKIICKCILTMSFELKLAEYFVKSCLHQQVVTQTLSTVSIYMSQHVQCVFMS